MDYVRLGSAGVKVSRICLGCMTFGGGLGGYGWTVDLEQSKPIIERALDLGINFFDTADEYSQGGSEKVVGSVLEGRRNDVVLATKVFFPVGSGPNDKGLSRKHVRAQVKRSLDNLGTDYIDLYQIHRWDYDTPIDETLRTLDDLVHVDGVVSYIGASSMFAWQFAKALYTSELLGLERFVSMQNHYNLCYREGEREMIPLCKSEGVAVLPWSPLARGFLSGKYKRGEKPSGRRFDKDEYLTLRYFKPEDFDIVERVEAVAKERGVTPSQIALSWLLNKRDVVAPVVGASKLEHVDDAAAAPSIALSDKERRYLEEPYKPHDILGHS